MAFSDYTERTMLSQSCMGCSSGAHFHRLRARSWPCTWMEMATTRWRSPCRSYSSMAWSLATYNVADYNNQHSWFRLSRPSFRIAATVSPAAHGNEAKIQDLETFLQHRQLSQVQQRLQYPHPGHPHQQRHFPGWIFRCELGWQPGLEQPAKLALLDWKSAIPSCANLFLSELL